MGIRDRIVVLERYRKQRLARVARPTKAERDAPVAAWLASPENLSISLDGISDDQPEKRAAIAAAFRADQ